MTSGFHTHRHACTDTCSHPPSPTHSHTHTHICHADRRHHLNHYFLIHKLDSSWFCCSPPPAYLAAYADATRHSAFLSHRTSLSMFFSLLCRYISHVFPDYFSTQALKYFCLTLRGEGTCERNKLPLQFTPSIVLCHGSRTLNARPFSTRTKYHRL